MSQSIQVNGQIINYPQTGDPNWGDNATNFAIQTSAALGKIGLSSGTSVDITQTLDVTGNTTLDANLSVGGNASVIGNTTLTGTLLNSDGTVSLPSFSYSADTNTGIYRSASDQQDFVTGGVSRARINSTGQQSSTISDLSGSNTTLYNEYKCRAWVNFNGTGTVAIRASGNVSSITDNGTGDYTVNFTTAMPDANYSIIGSNIGDTQVNSAIYIMSGGTANTTSSFRINTRNAPVNSNVDPTSVNIMVIR